MSSILNIFKRKPGHRKGATIATTPAAIDEIVRDILGGGYSSSGEEVTPLKALQVTTVFACVGVLAETIAMLPFKVYRRAKDGGKELDRNHPAYKVIARRPNPWMTPFEFREMQMQHLALRGNAYAFKVIVNGEVRELLPIPASLASVKQGRDWSLTYEVDFGMERGGRQVVPAGSMMHIRYRTLDGVTGISPIAYQRECVGLAKAAEKYGARLFKNNARPGGVLHHPKVMTDEAAKKFKKSWEAAFTGENQHKTALLEEGMTFNPISMSNEDAQYLETRRFQVEEIARIYRVPLHEIQANEKTTSWGSGIESMNIGFATRTIGPWVKRWEDAIMRDLFTADEQRKDEAFPKFSLEGLLRGDAKSRSEFYGVMVQNKIMTRNECRVLEDLNPVPGGDEFENPAITPGNGDEK